MENDADLKKKMYASQLSLRQMEAKLTYNLEVFGDYLAEREGYKEHDGMDALHYYLIQKHHWLPYQSRSLSVDDLRFLFEEEMAGWTLPKEAL
jgi:hypothetical protein